MAGLTVDKTLSPAADPQPVTASKIEALRKQLAAAERTADRIREALERAEWVRAFEGREEAP